MLLPSSVFVYILISCFFYIRCSSNERNLSIICNLFISNVTLLYYIFGLLFIFVVEINQKVYPPFKTLTDKKKKLYTRNPMQTSNKWTTTLGDFVFLKLCQVTLKLWMMCMMYIFVFLTEYHIKFKAEINGNFVLENWSHTFLVN